MSPLAILYFLLAASPVYNNWRHESSCPSTWEKESPIFGGRFESMMPFESIFNNEFFAGRNFEAEPMTRFNWLLRKAIRSNVFESSTRRHLVNEMTGLEMPSMFESEMSPIFRAVKLIKKIAKVNPIMIEKLLTRPESLFAVEKVMRHVAPESLFAVEKLINKNVPVYLREKIARRVVKSLLTSSLLSHKMSRRSIVSELYPTESIFSTLSTPMTSTFETLFNVESPIMTRHLIEKVMRHAEVARLVKKLIKKSIFSPRRSIVSEIFPTTFDFESTMPFSTLFNVESPIMTRHTVEKVLRNPIVLNKVIRRLVKKNIFEHERVLPVELLSTLSHVEPKLIKKIVKKVMRHELPVEVLSTLSHVEPKLIKKIVKKALRHELPVELSTLSHVEPKLIKKIVKKALRHELPVELSTLSHVEPKIVKTLLKKALRHELPVEVVLSKVIRRLVKSNVFEHEHENVLSTRRVEEVCRVCENVCESKNFFESKIVSSKVCRVCAEVCPTFAAPVFGRHFGLEHFDF